MKPNTVFLAIWVVFFPYWALAQDSLLQSGPMVGYSTMQEAGLWVQTNSPAEVHIRYWSEEQPDRIFRTEAVNTSSHLAYTAHLTADSLQPGLTYQYALYINNDLIDPGYKLAFQSQPLWKWRNDAPDFSFALGSCAYINQAQYDRPGEPYGRGYDIFHTILNTDPDFMLWLGDNTYLREADWNSRSGILGRYTHSRSVAELQPLLGSVHHYAIWDDHDYGPNDSDRSFWHKENTADAFRLFWRNLNYGQAGGNDICGTFFWHDVQFFLLDDRWYRAPRGLADTDKPMLGQSQMRWLKDALIYSDAAFKVVAVGSQVISDAAEGENYSTYAAERKELISFIRQHNITGVIFLSGDRHFSELSAYKQDGYPLYDLTVSPLTSGTYTPDESKNTLRVPETLVVDQNFALVEVTGPSDERAFTISIMDKSGKVLWKKSIFQNDLKQN